MYSIRKVFGRLGCEKLIVESINWHITFQKWGLYYVKLRILH